MQRVTIYQDSTQLPSEPYVSYMIFEQIIYNNQQPTTTTTPLLRHSQHPSPPEKSRDSSRLITWKRCPKCSGLLHAREPGNFGRGPIGCQNITAKKQGLR